MPVITLLNLNTLHKYPSYQMSHCVLFKIFHSTMMWNWTRRDSKNARIEANEPHLSDVSAEDLGTDSPGADKDAKESRLNRNQLRDSLEEQVFIQ